MMADSMAAEAEKRRENEEYNRAVCVLNSLQYGANFGSMDEDKKKKVLMVQNCLGRIGMSMDQVDKLSIIHVTGTKGKGSTCAYADSILRHHGYKTGCFSSPHLVEARERIMLNGKPIQKKIFSAAFWHVFDKLQATRARSNGLMPGYFAAMLLMALHVFVEQKVDVVLLEVGVGGEYDATNFIRNPVVCGITSLHLEHTDVLGHTVEEIAWNKAGIAKPGLPLVVVLLQESVLCVILVRTLEKKCPLFIAPPLKEEEVGAPLGIAGDCQAGNAALALQLCRIWLQVKRQGKMMTSYNEINITSVQTIPRRESTHLTMEEKQGVTEARLPGRNQVVKTQGVTYYLDGAHTPDSMKQCVSWFNDLARKEMEQIQGNVSRVLVFRMKKTKKASDHLPLLVDCGFQRAAFCPHVVSTSARDQFPDSMDLTEDPAEAKKIADLQLDDWRQLLAQALSPVPCVPMCFPSTVSALWWAGMGKDQSLREMATADLEMSTDLEMSANLEMPFDPALSEVDHVQVLVTGSQIMVGGALTVIQPDLWK